MEKGWSFNQMVCNQEMQQLSVVMMSWVQVWLDLSFLIKYYYSDTYMKVKKIGIKLFLRRIWLSSASKIKPYQVKSSQTRTQFIIATDNCHIIVELKPSILRKLLLRKNLTQKFSYKILCKFVSNLMPSVQYPTKSVIVSSIH